MTTSIKLSPLFGLMMMMMLCKPNVSLYLEKPGSEMDIFGYTLDVSQFKSTHEKAVGHCHDKFQGNLMTITSQRDLDLCRDVLDSSNIQGNSEVHVVIAIKSPGHVTGDTTKLPVKGVINRNKCTTLRFENFRPVFNTVSCDTNLHFLCQIPNNYGHKWHKRKVRRSYSFLFAQKNILELFQPSPFDASSCRPVVMNNYENSLASRVVGGSTAQYGLHPWQVEIAQVRHDRRHHLCSGVIIAERFILSVAHCYKSHEKHMQSLRVITGDHNIEKRDQHESEYEIESIAIHYKHRASMYENDIALLKLKSKMNRGIVFGSHVKPVCMPEPDTDHIPGTNCVVSGWGFTEESLMANISTVLQSAQVQLLSTEKCRDMYKNYNPVNDGMLCAGSLQGGIDSCDGDSGGPLVCNVSDTMYLFGLVSWGDGCGLPHRPGVYVKVQYYLEWIKTQIQELS